MPIRKFEIEADIPDGYEPTGEFRQPNPDDWFITSSGDLLKAPYGTSPAPRLILRPEWKWPEWVKPGTWYVRNENGTHSLSENEPSRKASYWRPGEGVELVLTREEAELIGFTPPPCTDWKLSKRQKPV